MSLLGTSGLRDRREAKERGVGVGSKSSMIRLTAAETPARSHQYALRRNGDFARDSAGLLRHASAASARRSYRW
jgi:hypothetical protein